MTRRPPGVPAARKGKGHPRREARRVRAAERQAAHVCGPTCKRFRRGQADQGRSKAAALLGLVPNLTGGVPSEEWVRRIREQR